MFSSEALAAALRELQTLARSEWIKRVGYTNALTALAWFDALGITNGGRQGRERRLVVTLEDAVGIILNSQYNQPVDPTPRLHTLGHRRTSAFFLVVYDPEELFNVGAKFDACSVWGVSGNTPPRRGELPAGIVLDYHKGSVRRRFVFNGVCLVEIALASSDFFSVSACLYYSVERKEHTLLLYL